MESNIHMGHLKITSVRVEMELRGLLPKNLQKVAKGGTAPRLVVPTMIICGP